MTTQEILSLLQGVTQFGKSWKAKCPAHDDHNPSLSVWIDKDGNTAICCHAGCPQSSILSAMGITWRDLKKDYQREVEIAHYDYFDPQRRPLCRVIRYVPKTFKRFKLLENGEIDKEASTSGLAALYRWPELAQAVSEGKTVYLVEGEKDVENMVKAGAVATTNLSGVKYWRKEYAENFKGAEKVFVIADRDGEKAHFEGQKGALRRKADIAALGIPVRAVCLPAEINGHKVKDASDALAAGWTLADIEAHCESADEVILPENAVKHTGSGAGAQGELLPQDAGRGERPDPADAATLREAVELAVVQASWYDRDGHIHPPRAEEKRGAVKKAGIEWMMRHGGFYRDSEAKGAEAAYFYENATRRLYSMASEEFAFWLGWASGLDAIGNDFRELIVACKEVAFHDSRSVEVAPSLFWDYRDGRIYVSNGDGEMARIDAAGVAIVENGTDGVLFRSGRTCAPWRLLPEAEGVPMHSMRLVGGISTPENPLAPLLLLLWILALPRNLKNKPPLSLCGEVGSGKTRSARGIYEMLGMVERVSSADKSEKGEDQFWVSVGYGGISTIDNVDSKIKWLADAVAGSSTGAQKEKRTLYTDSDLTFLRSRSAVILTSANSNYATDAGLADRLINVVFSRHEGGATSDGELSEEIERHRDGLMTWFCYTLSHALRVTESPPDVFNRRHPDWADWCWRCGVALGYRAETEAALARAEKDKAEIAVKSDLFIGAVLWRMMAELGEPWEGTAKELREFLIKGGGPGAGHRPGTPFAFAESAVAPEPYEADAKEALTVRKIGNYLSHNKTALTKVFALKSSERGREGVTWTLSPPKKSRSCDSCDSESPFLTFIKKTFSCAKDENALSESQQSQDPAVETITDPENAPFL